ncbi:protease inhibitor Inh/omp19 family protein [Pararhizobium haloflavum]|uniref:protease inhibitor Inh/omp19 family protein n=1 Tax=Pararhizobium haloflavum TaxID=2037914 RepID=UPI0012FFE020|nr:protease inhibitor Inh/omp19 family protein [Pararhizobium haloflavum]
MRISHAVTIALVALAVTGCQRTSVGPMSPTAVPTTPEPLTPAPVGGVQGSQLPPASGSDFPDAPAAQDNAGDQQAFEMAAASAPDITREALLGTWQTAVAGGNCQLALSLTQWTGGYRAASLRCPGPAANIASWNVSGNQVVLNDRDGNQVAQLYQAAPERYQGSLAAGGSITLSR